MIRTITLPATNRTISLAVYLRGVRTAIANPTLTYPSGLTTWWPTSGAEIRQQFRRSIHDRINQAIPYTLRGQQ